MRRVALAKNLHAARKATGLTIRELAKVSKISRDYIGQIESSVANVSIDVVGRLAEHIGTSPFELLQPPQSSLKRKHAP